MSKKLVFILMFIILTVNTAIFSLVYANQTQALPSGLQGFSDNLNGAPRFGNHIYGDFALNLDKPMDVTRTSEFIYVSDTNNKRVQVFDLGGDPLFSFGEQGKGPGQFNFPYGIAGDNQGKVYVADMYNANISVFDSKGEFIEYFAPQLSENKTLRSPAGLRIVNELVYITDIQSGKVFVLDLAGNLLNEIGGNGSEEGQFQAPNAVAVDKEGNIYVVDTGNQRVQKLDSEGNFVLSFNGTSSSLAESIFVNPRGIGINSHGTIYVVSNLTHMVHGFDLEGNELFSFGGMGQGPDQLYLPNGLFIDGNDNIYITDTLNQRISVFK